MYISVPLFSEVLYAFEMEARSFASSMTKQLLSGSMKDAEVALKALDACRLLLRPKFLGGLGRSQKDQRKSMRENRRLI